MGSIVYKNLEKSESLHSSIEYLMESLKLGESRVTMEKRNKSFFMKACNGNFVFSEKNSDPYSLVDKVLMGLYKQIKEYDKKKKSMLRKIKSGNTASEEIKKIKKFVIKPMTESEAVEHMKILGHKFYIYIDDSGRSILLFKNNEDIFAQTIFLEFTLEDAIVKLLDEEMNYLAFMDKDTEVMTVVYKRKAGTVGIIDANMQ
jgi:ribosome-associated translation inhibitor RaiA